MLVIGERINTSRKRVEPGVRSRNEEFLAEEARKQAEGGADYLDVNVATMMAHEPEYMEWAVGVVQRAAELPVCIDSPNPAAMEAALRVHDNSLGRPIVSSTSAEPERYDKIVPLVLKHRCPVIALCMDESGIPQSAADALRIATRLAERLGSDGVPLEDVYLDPLVRPVSTGGHYGPAVLDALRQIKAEIPEAKTVIGLSNVSFGLPVRKWLNRAFMVMCLASGVDAAIIDPCDSALMALISASEALAARDEFCANYLAMHRAGRLEAAE